MLGIDPSDFGKIAASVASVFLIMGVGAVCRTKHWLTKHADLSLAKITANVLLPSLFFDRILNDPSLESLEGAWQPPLFGFLMTACSFGLSLLFARVFGPVLGLITDASQRAFALCVGVCNYGYIPLPLCQIFYPDAEVELIFHNVGVDLALWSVGLAVISGGGPSPFSRHAPPPVESSSSETSVPGATSRPTTPPSRWTWLQSLISPPLVAAAVGLSIRASGFTPMIPDSFLKSLHWLAGTSIPMGLLLSGAIIIDFLRSATWAGAWPVIVAALGFRQLLMPILMLLVAATIAPTVDLKQVLLLQAAMPTAIFPIVLVRLHEGDTATALRAVLATNLAGIVLIPIWMAIGARWLF